MDDPEKDDAEDGKKVEKKGGDSKKEAGRVSVRPGGWNRGGNAAPPR